MDRTARAVSLVLLAAMACSVVESCLPPAGSSVYVQEQVAILKAVLDADKSLAVTTSQAAPASDGSTTSEMRIDCKACSDQKARALATLLAIAAPDLGAPEPAAAAGGGEAARPQRSVPRERAAAAPFDPAMAAAVRGEAAAAAAMPPMQRMGGPTARVDAYVVRGGARVAAAAAAATVSSGDSAKVALLQSALSGNALFAKTVVKQGPVTSCDAPAGPYVLSPATVVMPDCPSVLHPSTVAGAARCPMLAASALDRAFSLSKRMGVQTGTVAA